MHVPYNINFIDINEYSFLTSNDITYSLTFRLFRSIELFNINNIECYSFDFSPDKKTLLKDSRIEISIIAALREFFNNNNSVIFFLCNPDGKQHVRNYLFNKWFDKYNNHGLYIKHNAIITVDDTNYFFSIIYSASHNSADIITKMFDTSVIELDNKPE